MLRQRMCLSTHSLNVQYRYLIVLHPPKNTCALQQAGEGFPTLALIEKVSQTLNRGYFQTRIPVLLIENLSRGKC